MDRVIRRGEVRLLRDEIKEENCSTDRVKNQAQTRYKHCSSSPVKPEAATAVELLMMGVRTTETC
jgi:hypothetical protein